MSFETPSPQPVKPAAQEVKKQEVKKPVKPEESDLQRMLAEEEAMDRFFNAAKGAVEVLAFTEEYAKAITNLGKMKRQSDPRLSRWAKETFETLSGLINSMANSEAKPDDPALLDKIKKTMKLVKEVNLMASVPPQEPGAEEKKAAEERARRKEVESNAEWREWWENEQHMRRW